MEDKMLARLDMAAPEVAGLSVGALALQAELKDGQTQSLHQLAWSDGSIAVTLGLDSVWLILRRPGHGGLALRTAYAPGGLAATVTRRQLTECVIQTKSPLGVHEVSVRFTGEGVLQATTTLTPAKDLLIPYLPRDLYPLDEHDDPLGAAGCVEAAQRGVNGGMLYFCLAQPAFGHVFYFQNLTALNAFFIATETTPDGVVGGQWPELGYQPPTMLGNSPPTKALPGGRPTVLSDVHLRVRQDCAQGEQASALMFLDMLADVYAGLDKPATDFRDWPGRADLTLKDLARSKDASIRHYGHTYLHPYVAAEYPDSMVQLSVLTAVHEYGRWRGKPHPLEAELAAGLGKFFDSKLGVVRRYLPNVGKDKNRFAVDSWYLYHPLTNLARLTRDGDKTASDLFFGSLDYAIKAARHFRYQWPIQYDVRDFTVLVPSRNDQGLGQTDVGGIYAYVMMQAFELTGKARFRREAEKALRAGEGLRFEMAYQANLSAWGAVAALKLWRLTEDRWFHGQSHVYLAGLFHNSEVWESQIKSAQHFRNFLGLTCLHDGPYMAIYECFESYWALQDYLEVAGQDIEPSVKLLISEYSRYGFDRAWFYYPDALPADILSEKVRNGHLDRTLSFPLEDLYGDGQPCGQVGQEIYGCGAAFIYASLGFHQRKGMPFTLFCDRRVEGLVVDACTATLTIDAPLGSATRIVVSSKGRRFATRLSVSSTFGPCQPLLTTSDRMEFEAPPGCTALTLTWA
jgi:hypothetical protein